VGAPPRIAEGDALLLARYDERAEPAEGVGGTGLQGRHGEDGGREQELHTEEVAFHFFSFSASDLLQNGRKIGVYVKYS
jgi:hypothetical protein